MMFLAAHRWDGHGCLLPSYRSRFSPIMLVTAVLACLLTAGFAVSADAANISCINRPNETGKCEAILVQGDIVRGDLRRLEIALDPDRYRDIGAVSPINNRWAADTRVVYLHSRGGDVLEAMAMGRLIRELYLITVAPSRWGQDFRLGRLTMFEGGTGPNGWKEACRGPECVCASACFLVWAGGIKREGDYLMVHRPRATAEMVLALGVTDTRAALSEIRRRVEAYLTDMEVPTGAIRQMMDTDPTSLSDVRIWNPNVRDHGFIPSILDSLTETCRIPSLREREQLIRLERQVFALQESGQPVPWHLRDYYGEINTRDVESVNCIWRSISMDATSARSDWQTRGFIARFDAWQRQRDDEQRRYRAEQLQICEARKKAREGKEEADEEYDREYVPGVGTVGFHFSYCVRALTQAERDRLFQEVRESVARNENQPGPPPTR
jgi:hypothetical protein